MRPAFASSCWASLFSRSVAGRLVRAMVSAVVKPSRRIPKAHRRRLKRLAEWLERTAWPNNAAPGSFLLPEVVVNDKLVVRHSKEMGLGLWTRSGSSLRAGEALLSVPRRAAILFDDLVARHQQAIGSLVDFVRRDSEMLMDAAPFALMLLVESRGCGAGDKRWGPYFDAMDPNADHLPLMWPDKDLAMLEGSGTFRAVMTMRAELQDMYQLMQMDDALRRYCPKLVIGPSRATFRDSSGLQHILSNLSVSIQTVVRLRASATSLVKMANIVKKGLRDVTFVIQPQNNGATAPSSKNNSAGSRSRQAPKALIHGLVPWAHLFNHHHNAASHYRLDQSRERIDFWTARAYGPDEQVFINYGRLSSAVSIINYGFLEDDPSLQYSKSPDVIQNAYDHEVGHGNARGSFRVVESPFERLVLRLNLFGPNESFPASSNA